MENPFDRNPSKNYQLAFYNGVVERVVNRISNDPTIEISDETLMRFSNRWKTKIKESFSIKDMYPFKAEHPMIDSREIANFHMAGKFNKPHIANVLSHAKLKEQRTIAINPESYHTFSLVANDNTGEQRTLSDAATRATLALHNVFNRDPMPSGIKNEFKDKSGTSSEFDELKKYQLDGEYMESSEENVDEPKGEISEDEEISREEIDDVSREEVSKEEEESSEEDDVSREEEDDVSRDEASEQCSSAASHSEDSDSGDSLNNVKTMSTENKKLEFGNVAIDYDAIKEEIPEETVEEEPLNSADDLSEDKVIETTEPENVVVCQYKTVKKVKRKWKLLLKSGIANVYGTDIIFHRASGESFW